MRVRAISDLHGAVEHLEAAGRDCDALLVLGDLINVLDYRSWGGILVELFGREPVEEAARLRAEGRFAEARTTIAQRVGPDFDYRTRFSQLAREQYRRVFAAMPAHAYVTFGNVDVPEILHEVMPPTVRFVDGEVVRIGAWRFGFVGGGVRTPLGIPGEVPGYEAQFERLGSVDVICTHMPPRLPWYCYDVVARKFEPGSVGLLGFIQDHRPRWALFGHVHQPLVGRGTIGATELVNVGHFQAHGEGFTLDVPD
jgi:Icc-related predicted phosphoesterase